MDIGTDKDFVKLEVHGRGCCDPVPLRTPEGTTEEVKLLAAMSDPTRLQIVAMLASQQEALCVCEIMPHFELGQPTISHHLKVLRDAHLVTSEKKGLWVYYSIDHAKLEQAASYLNALVALKRVPVALG